MNVHSRQIPECIELLFSICAPEPVFCIDGDTLGTQGKNLMLITYMMNEVIYIKM